MLQQEHGDDYVIASGEAHSVRDFCEAAFSHAGLNYEDYVVVDQQFFRPAEVELLLGNPAKAKRVLGWEYKRTFKELVHEMVDADLSLMK